MTTMETAAASSDSSQELDASDIDALRQEIDRLDAAILGVHAERDAGDFLGDGEGVNHQKERRRKQHDPASLRVAGAGEKLLDNERPDALKHAAIPDACAWSAP